MPRHEQWRCPRQYFRLTHAVQSYLNHCQMTRTLTNTCCWVGTGSCRCPISFFSMPAPATYIINILAPLVGRVFTDFYLYQCLRFYEIRFPTFERGSLLLCYDCSILSVVILQVLLWFTWAAFVDHYSRILLDSFRKARQLLG